jgi:hypothetical protein
MILRRNMSVRTGYPYCTYLHRKQQQQQLATVWAAVTLRLCFVVSLRPCNSVTSHYDTKSHHRQQSFYLSTSHYDYFFLPIHACRANTRFKSSHKQVAYKALVLRYSFVELQQGLESHSIGETFIAVG